MWLAEKAAEGTRGDEPGTEIGLVTSAGTRPSVMLGGERRSVEIASPGGFYWAPAQGQQVLVTRCGDELFVSGALDAAPELPAGGVMVKSGEAWVRLGADGALELHGVVNVAGTLLLNGVDIRKLMSPL